MQSNTNITILISIIAVAGVAFHFTRLILEWQDIHGYLLPVATHPEKNTFMLMDTPSGDGFEAMVALEEQVMSMFECDPELLEFASSTSNAKRTL